jgi:glycosyltransferase involved in cell wall biosynthesis
VPGLLRSAAWAEGPSPEVSVVVSTFGREQLLPGLLDALDRQETVVPFEVVVADNGSPDRTWDVLAAHSRRTAVAFTAVRAGENRGAGGGRNLAVARSRGGVLAFTDDDCLPTPHWVERIAAPFAEAEVTVVQGRTEPEPGPAPGPWARSMWVTGPTPWLETCNLAFRRTGYDAAGGFDEQPPGAGRRAFGEDTELGHRVLARGGRRVFADGAVVHHRWRPGTFADHLAERRVMRGFPRLAARVPAVRAACWGGVFLSRRTAAVDLAVASVVVAAASRRPAALLGAMPWLRTAWGPARARRGPLPLRLAQAAAADLAGLAALAQGSVEHRRLLL